MNDRGGPLVDACGVERYGGAKAAAHQSGPAGIDLRPGEEIIQRVPGILHLLRQHNPPESPSLSPQPRMLKRSAT